MEVATGASPQPIAASLDGEATSAVPASILQRHANVVVVVAEHAALSMSTYHRDHQGIIT